MRKSPLPQHWTVLSVRIPHACSCPLASEVNVPSGASSWSKLLIPQQATVPLTLMAHAKGYRAADTDVNSPGGGLA